MPRRWRWLVPITALMAMLPCAGASAAPQPMSDLPMYLAEHREQAAKRAEKRRARVDGVVKTAGAQIGDGYAYGGTGPDGFDCSGLTAYVFAEAGIALPHTSHGQAAMGRSVDRDDIRRGDLVFFSTAGPGASHVGIATSASTAISATNGGVMEHSMTDAYWGGQYVGARRLP
jgi:cell wall-associated NlpC family hydrolase